MLSFATLSRIKTKFNRLFIILTRTRFYYEFDFVLFIKLCNLYFTKLTKSQIVILNKKKFFIAATKKSGSLHTNV